MRLDEPDGHEPMVTRVRDVLASFLREGIAPGRGGLVGAREQIVEELAGGLGLDQAAQAEADVPALVELDALDAVAHPRQGAVGQVGAQHVMRGVEDDSLEHHVVERDALAQPDATGGQLGCHGGQPLFEELEHPSRDVGPGRFAPLGGGGSGQSEYLGGDPVEPQRMAVLVAALQEEDPGHQALVGGQARLPGHVGERRDVLGDRVLGHAEAGENGHETAATLSRELRPGPRILGEVDGRRVPLQAGDDLGEELGPEGAPREHEVPAQRALPELPISHSLERVSTRWLGKTLIRVARAPQHLAGYARSAAAYERGRPGYPPAAVDFLAARLRLGPGRTVVDLAAGTGKLTRPLLATGAQVVAVEPVAEMRAALPAGARAVDGTAEAMPLSAGSADAVAVAQAFHWFDGDAALAEIHRVLRPGCSLALVWNRRRMDDPLNQAIEDLLAPYRGHRSALHADDWHRAFDETKLFGPLEECVFPNEQSLNADGLADRVASVNFIAALDEKERTKVVRAARALAAPAGVTIRQDTEVLVTDRLG